MVHPQPEPPEPPGSDDVSALLPELHEELRKIAGAYMRRERTDHTLQPTALVNEAYLRIAKSASMHWSSRPQFLAVAAQMMRQILVEHARTKGRQKRGGGWTRVAFDTVAEDLAVQEVDLLDLDEAIDAFAEVHPRGSRVVELRFFGGLTVPETAEVLGVSARTAEDDWFVARAWLRGRLSAAS